jgi:hypothetical protein
MAPHPKPLRPDFTVDVLRKIAAAASSKPREAKFTRVADILEGKKTKDDLSERGYKMWLRYVREINDGPSPKVELAKIKHGKSPVGGPRVEIRTDISPAHLRDAAKGKKGSTATLLLAYADWVETGNIEVAARLVSRSTLLRLRPLFQAEGVEGLTEKKLDAGDVATLRKVLAAASSGVQKRQTQAMIDMAQAGITNNAAAIKHEIQPGTLDNVVRNFIVKGADVFKSRQEQAIAKRTDKDRAMELLATLPTLTSEVSINRAKSLIEVYQGHPLPDVMVRYHIQTRNTLTRWLREFERHGLSSLLAAGDRDK